MGYDNECILNIQSLPGEYFCPVCRTLIYPNEALQSQCTHLYCKPCLAYVVATTHACPYDGYLVTEADSKPLTESSKELAETIGKVEVHCLYHRSGCQWQGTLSESTAHCAGCNYGNSPVVCNRCGTQIIHRQVQEHAQICPGVQPQTHLAENAQAQAAAVASQAAAQDASSAASAAAASASTAMTTAPATATMAAPTVTAASAPASVPAAATSQVQVQGGAAVYPQAVAQAPSAEQWYQQQYQQYYQHYPGYDPYQQQYQQYAQYQQQVHPQYMQPHMQAAPQHAIPGQLQPQPYMQPQPLPQPLQQPQPQPLQQPQPQLQPQAQATQPQLQQHLPQPQPHPQPQTQQPIPAQVPQIQAQQPHVPQQHPHPQLQVHPPPHGHVAGQPYHQPLHPQPQPQPHSQARPPQLQAPPQPVPSQQLPHQMQHPQHHPQQQPLPQHPPHTHPPPHPQPQIQQTPMQMQPQPQPHLHAQSHSQPIPQTQPSQPLAHAVSGFQSYPQPIPGAPQQRPVHMHPQQQGMPPQQSQSQAHFPPQQPPQMRPPHAQMPMQIQQQPAMPPPQGPHPNLHPTQQQVQHPVHQPGQQIYQQPVLQPHAPQQGYPQPQAQGPLHPGQSQQQGTVPPQHHIHPPQSLRPQGSLYMQQPIPGQPHTHLNAPSAQSLPPHQAQARPMMVNQGMPQQPVQQSPGAGPKLMQSGMNQQSPSQSYTGRATTRAPTSSELQPGTMLQSLLPHSGSQGGLVLTSPATPKRGASILDKVGQSSEPGLAEKNAEGTEAGEKIPEHVSDSKFNSDEEKAATKVKDKYMQADNDSKGVLESAKETDVDGLQIKQVKEEERTNLSGEVTDGLHDLKVVGEEKEIRGQEGKPDGRSSAQVEGGDVRPNLERAVQGFVSEGQISGHVVNHMQPPQQMSAAGGLDRGQVQQPTYQNVLPAQERGFPQPGYHDRNPSQFPQQYPGSDDHRGMPPGGPLPHQERYPPQHIPYRHPQVPDSELASQRPPAPDRVFPQPMHQSIQERRFPEPPPPHQMQVYGQTMPPGQMRPPGHGIRETFPHQAPEPFWPPPHTGAPGAGLPPPPHSGAPGAGLPPPLAGILAHHGFPQKGFEQQAMTPQGQTQSHMPLPHAGGASSALAEPLARPVMGGPPPGTFDTPSRMMGGGPSFIPEDKVGRAAPFNSMEAEAHTLKRPGLYDGRHLEPHRPVPTEHSPYGQPNVMKMNGMANIAPVSGVQDSAFGLPGERFRPLPEERFKPFPEEGFRPSASDPGRHIINRREFEEDLKQFPRPGHLDGEGAPRFDGYLSSSRPLDRTSQHSGGVNALTSRPLPSYQSGAPFQPHIGSSEDHLNLGDRDRPVALHEHLGRKHDATVAHPDRLNLVTEFGRHRVDSFPPLRSPGHFNRDIPDGPGSLRMEQLGSSGLPGQLRRGLDGRGPLAHGLSSDIRGETVSSQNLPHILRSGGFRGHLDMGEPGNLPSHLRIGDPGVNGPFSSVSRDGEIDTFEQLRKRKPGGVVLCRICKIDCETVEGLELHSQTREHQKMAMDMVLSIKQENAKKHKLTSDNAMPFEDANKSRKMSFENRGKRQ